MRLKFRQVCNALCSETSDNNSFPLEFVEDFYWNLPRRWEGVQHEDEIAQVSRHIMSKINGNCTPYKLNCATTNKKDTEEMNDVKEESSCHAEATALSIPGTIEPVGVPLKSVEDAEPKKYRISNYCIRNSASVHILSGRMTNPLTHLVTSKRKEKPKDCLDTIRVTIDPNTSRLSQIH